MSVREVSLKQITKVVSDMVIDANYNLPDDVRDALEKMHKEEESDLCKSIIEDIIKNANIARDKQKPICQDTGMAVFFVELGQDVHLVDGSLQEAFDEGVRDGYKRGYLRKGTQEYAVGERVNRGDNTPAIVHVEIVPGDKVKITACPKGFGSENMSKLAMLTPSVGWEGVKKFIIDTVRDAGPNPCPPIIVGVGIGGTMEVVAYNAKKALIRKTNERSKDPKIALLEEELLEEINKLGIGAQGFGGTRTALAVHIISHPTHIAGMAVCVNINCHVARHKTVII
ncbi:MAG: fumarate hydratase [Eubacteriales bacterium]|nr:fumarate hydratase [Eubacteriales bacterium]